MRQLIGRSWLVVLVVLVAALAAQSAVAGGGNSPNAKQCQKNGWTSLATSSGGGFASESACTSYSAQGGQLFAPRMTVTPTSFEEDETQDSALLTATGSGFHPNSQGTIFFEVQGQAPYASYPAATDSSGKVTFYTVFGQWAPGSCAIIGSSSQTLVAVYTDSSGVTATSNAFTVNIC